MFPAGSKNPTSYDTMLNAQYCGYDNNGNLFVDGFDGQSIGLSEMPEGSGGFEKLNFDQNYGDPGQIQWDGQYMTYESQEGGQPTILRFTVSGSSTKIVGRTLLKRVPSALRLSWIYEGSVVAPYSRSGPAAKNVGVSKYPKGGSIKRIIQFGDFDKKPFDFSAATISVP